MPINDFFIDSTNSIVNAFDITQMHIPTHTRRSKLLLENLERLWMFKEQLADAESARTCSALFKVFLASAFFPREKCFELYGPINKRTWLRYRKIATTMDSQIEGDYLLDRIETWLLNGYSYQDRCKADLGDIVVDGGAHTGTTAVYFRKLVGSVGKVYAFEPLPDSFSMLSNNIQRLGFDNIILTKAALAEVEGTLTFQQQKNSASSRLDLAGNLEVAAITIDAFVEKNNLERIDFIKLDIEGAELGALDGATQTIRRCHPKMALSLYHNPSDFIEIPDKVLAIKPEYRFYLKHNSCSYAETVLFCLPSETAASAANVQGANESVISLYKSIQQKFREQVSTATCDKFLRYLSAVSPLSPFLVNGNAHNMLALPMISKEKNCYAVILENSYIDLQIRIYDGSVKIETTEAASQRIHECLQKHYPESQIKKHDKWHCIYVRIKRDSEGSLKVAAETFAHMVKRSLETLYEMELISKTFSVLYASCKAPVN